jgi:hypothetical protein
MELSCGTSKTMDEHQQWDRIWLGGKLALLWVRSIEGANSRIGEACRRNLVAPGSGVLL